MQHKIVLHVSGLTLDGLYSPLSAELRGELTELVSDRIVEQNMQQLRDMVNDRDDKLIRIRNRSLWRRIRNQ